MKTSLRASNLPEHARAGLRFECQSDCGACCMRPGSLPVDRDEIRQLAGSLGSGIRAFKRHYLMRGKRGYQVKDGESGACVFLNEEMLCRVYDARPRQCRSYPFWDRIVADRQRWSLEGLRCPGIDVGRLIPAEEIEAWLRPGPEKCSKSGCG